jgi:Arylsulfotransferase (ASST)
MRAAADTHWTRRRFLRTAGAAGAGSLAAVTLGAARGQAAGATSAGSAAVIPYPADGLRAFRSRPDLAPPAIQVVTDTGDAAQGLIFVNADGAMIVDDRGDVVWYHPASGRTVTNVRVQSYAGRPVLTWWEGTLVGGHGEGDYVILDDTYRVLRRVEARGFLGDLHEFLLTPRGTALLTAYNTVGADLSAVGGPTSGLVVDGIVQEIDVATGDLVFEWHSLDHVDVDRSYSPYDPSSEYDYFHVNSIDLDAEGGLIVSARNTWAVYKLDYPSGDVVWTLGGKGSDFAMGDGTPFAWQHDARRQADGSLTLFDDEGDPPVGDHSRALVLDLDESAMTATLRAEYAHPTDLLTGSQGDAQVLPDGHVFVGRGAQPYFTEFDAAGNVVYDARFYTSNASYRAFRQQWVAQPLDLPAVSTLPGDGDAVTVFASWNGATEVTRWEVLAGPGSSQLTRIAVADRAGFETAIEVRTTETYVAVRALDASGAALGTSRPAVARA